MFAPARSTYAGVMRSFSCRPLILSVCSEPHGPPHSSWDTAHPSAAVPAVEAGTASRSTARVSERRLFLLTPPRGTVYSAHDVVEVTSREGTSPWHRRTALQLPLIRTSGATGLRARRFM